MTEDLKIILGSKLQNFDNIFSTFALMSMKQTKNMEEKGKVVMVQFLEDYAAIMDLAKKIERVCIIINKMARSWKKQCELNHTRVKELQDMFN